MCRRLSRVLRRWSAPANADAGATAAASVITISRADWKAEDAELRVEGEVTNPSLALTAEFLGRSEPLANDGGSFEGIFAGVATNPGTVTVRGADGSSAMLTVEVD